MKTSLFIIFTYFAHFASCFSKPLRALTYEAARTAVIDAEDLLSAGGRMLLSPQEKYVERILRKYRNEEITSGLLDPSNYAPGLHFFRAKDMIDKSNVFKFIRKMPKGALLHGHNSAMVSSEWVIQNLSYYPGLLKCESDTGNILLTFEKYNPDNKNCRSLYVERRRAKDPKAFDKELEKLINLHTENPESEYFHIASVWKKFENMFETISGLIRYLPAFQAYHKRLLEEMYDDGVMYIEFRSSFGTGYDEFGNTYSTIDMAGILKKIIEEFKMSHENFLGAKVIYSTSRRVDIEKLKKKISIYKELYQIYPDFIIGFDLVGQEDLGKPIREFLPVLGTLPRNTNFFFHAGETNWYGSDVDENVLDALLLNTTRIGHGFAIMKHPVMWNAIKQRDIAIEINPISNQVLHLLLDLRNHPAAFYTSQNIPIVISNDDPGFWNAKGMSYDYYYAFMCFTHIKSGLKSLKKLVWDSVKYAVLSPYERSEAFIILQRMWDAFLEDIIKKSYS